MTHSHQLEETNSAYRIMQGFTQFLLGGELDQWADLFAADAVFEFPYSPAGYPQKLEGKAAIAKHIHELFGQMEISRFSEPVIMIAQDKEQFVAEFTCEGRSLLTNKPYHQTYISVVTHQNGEITHFKDYWNPMVVLESVQPE